ncbi:MAG: ABC transporter substrate-binding protein [Oscillospiraceae bacterium]|jgi:putative ABC transport system substrate-binding protein|nr:ABC transporter substrate-binding protein [Oscillospiraceae bacterium]
MKRALSMLLTLLLTIGLFCLPAQAAAPAPIKVGILQLMDHPSLQIIETAIQDELKALGLTDRIALTYVNAQGDFPNLPLLASQLVGEGCTLLIPITTPCAQAAVTAAQDAGNVDVIFAAVTDPYAAALLPLEPDPAVRVAGVSDEVAVDRILDMAQKLTPGFDTIGLLYNAGEANSVSGVDAAKAYAQSHGLQVTEAVVSSTAEVAQAAQSLAGKADICFTSNDNTVASAMPVYAQMGLDNKIPVYVGADTMVADGGLATIGINYTDLGKAVAAMVQEYLDGATPAQLGVRVLPGGVPIINVDVAEALGITIPEDLQGAQLLHTGDAL